MDRYRINTYSAALAAMIPHLWDVGQISPRVVTQLHMAANRGQLARVTEDYPAYGGIPTLAFRLS